MQMCNCGESLLDKRLAMGIQGFARTQSFLVVPCTIFLLLHAYGLASWGMGRKGKEGGLVGSAFDQCRVLGERTCR